MEATNLDVLHIPQDDLGVEHVGQLAHHLTLYGKLLIEQGQVILQLSMRRDQDTFTFGVILRTTSSTKHLKSEEMHLIYLLLVEAADYIAT